MSEAMPVAEFAPNLRNPLDRAKMYKRMGLDTTKLGWYKRGSKLLQHDPQALEREKAERQKQREAQAREEQRERLAAYDRRRAGEQELDQAEAAAAAEQHQAWLASLEGPARAAHLAECVRVINLHRAALQRVEAAEAELRATEALEWTSRPGSFKQRADIAAGVAQLGRDARLALRARDRAEKDCQVLEFDLPDFEARGGGFGPPESVIVLPPPDENSAPDLSPRPAPWLVAAQGPTYWSQMLPSAAEMRSIGEQEQRYRVLVGEWNSKVGQRHRVEQLLRRQCGLPAEYLH